jgi:glucuronate isomerase
MTASCCKTIPPKGSTMNMPGISRSSITTAIFLPEEVAGDRRFASMTKIWLDGDHYKWRAMRANGVPEKYCTGDAPDEEKFMKWAETVPHTLRNPLYHWTHMELRRPFGIQKLLDPSTAREIYGQCNAMLQGPGFSAQKHHEENESGTGLHHRRSGRQPGTSY